MKAEFLSYTAADFAAEPLFLQGLSGQSPEIAAAWEKWLQAHPEKKPEMEAARSLVMQLGQARFQDPAVDTDALWQRIEAEALAGETAPKVRRLRPLWTGLAVAVAAALLLFFLLRGPGTTTVVAPAGEDLALTLPDQSSLQLNASSEVVYGVHFAEKRQLQLQGEAFFSVTSGSPFVIETAAGQVEVLGTRFNVYQREEDFRVVCVSGRVRVTPDEGKAVVLAAGEGVFYAGGKPLAVDAAQLQAETAWREGRYAFEAAPLKEVFGELERQFDLELSWPAGVAGATYTGHFTRGSVEEALHNVCWPMGLDFEVTGEGQYRIFPAAEKEEGL